MIDIRKELIKINPEAYDDAVRGAFEYSCLEAEFLGIEKKGKPFVKMCGVRENMMLKGLYDLFMKIYDRGDDPSQLDYELSTREEMLEEIRDQYATRPKKRR